MTFVRYGLVQLVAYAIDMGGFLLLLAAGAPPLPANVASKLAAGGFAFAAHRRYTFAVRAQRAMGQALRYTALLALNVPLSTGVLAALLRWIPQPGWAKLLADIIIVVFTYWASKLLVFRARSRGEAADEERVA